MAASTLARSELLRRSASVQLELLRLLPFLQTTTRARCLWRQHEQTLRLLFVSLRVTGRGQRVTASLRQMGLKPSKVGARNRTLTASLKLGMLSIRTTHSEERILTHRGVPSAINLNKTSPSTGLLILRETQTMVTLMTFSAKYLTRGSGRVPMLTFQPSEHASCWLRLGI